MTTLSELPKVLEPHPYRTANSTSHGQRSDAQLLLTYGFVSVTGEAALPTTARLTLAMIRDAAVVVRDGLGGGGASQALSWDAADGWAVKLAACEQLLTPHGGKVRIAKGNTSG